MNVENLKDAMLSAAMVAEEGSPGPADFATASDEEFVRAVVMAAREHKAATTEGGTITEAELEHGLVFIAEGFERYAAALRKRAARCRLRVVGAGEAEGKS